MRTVLSVAAAWFVLGPPAAAGRNDPIRCRGMTVRQCVNVYRNSVA